MKVILVKKDRIDIVPETDFEKKVIEDMLELELKVTDCNLDSKKPLPGFSAMVIELADGQKE